MPANVKRLICEADVFLAINMRFGEMTTDGYTLLSVPIPTQTLIHVRGSDREIGSIYQPALGIHARAQPIILILNTGIYGTIRAHQKRHYPARVSGTTLENPDVVMLAKSYGFHAERVELTEDFPAAFARRLRPRPGLAHRRGAGPQHPPRGADPDAAKDKK